MLKASGVALIGGGRWARVIADVLAGMLPAAMPVVLCSPGNAASWQQARPCRHWGVTDSLDRALRMDSLSHVIIARRARTHAATALRAIAAGHRVLVEKPFCLHADELAALRGAAAPQQCRCGLVYLFANYLSDFVELVAAAGHRPRAIALAWSDAASECRYGERKSYDPALNVAQDVLPHIWSIARAILPAGALSVEAVEIGGGGAQVALDLAIGGSAVRALLRREHGRRERHLTVTTPEATLALDFSTEPPAVRRNGRLLPIVFPPESPLRSELMQFLADRPAGLADIRVCAEAARLGFVIMPRIREAQRVLIGQGSEDDARAFAMREIAAGGIAAAGDPSSPAAIRRWAAGGDCATA